MIVCPFCEHEQASGEECDECGMKFSKSVAIPIAVPPLEGLEPTLFAQSDQIPPPEVTDWLEPTSAKSAAVLEAPVMPDLETTRLADAEVPSSLDMLTADSGGQPSGSEGWFEATLAAPAPEQPAREPAAVLCRYCRAPALADEVLCGRCGMRLPVWKPELTEIGDAPAICPSCGTPSVGEVCRSCGVRMPQGES